MLDDHLDADLVRRIEQDHLIVTPLAPADLLFVFGTRTGVDEFIEAIEDLWRRRYFKWAIVSGGLTPGADETEAAILSRRMIEAGIPSGHILVEERATNTGENVIFSLPILERHLGLPSIGSLIAVGKLCTSRRYLMTLQRHWPEVEKMLAPVNCFGVPRADWPLHAHSRRRVLDEWAKIEPYKARGFIVDWPPVAEPG